MKRIVQFLKNKTQNIKLYSNFFSTAICWALIFRVFLSLLYTCVFYWRCYLG